MPIALIVGNSDGIGLALTKSLLADGWHVTRKVSEVGFRYEDLEATSPLKSCA